MVKIQEQILDNCSRYLKNGGTLVYSTCTVFKKENREQIEKFLEKHKEYKLEEDISLYPHKHGTDGFYIAVLKKNGEI